MPAALHGGVEGRRTRRRVAQGGQLEQRRQERCEGTPGELAPAQREEAVGRLVGQQHRARLVGGKHRHRAVFNQHAQLLLRILAAGHLLLEHAQVEGSCLAAPHRAVDKQRYPGKGREVERFPRNTRSPVPRVAVEALCQPGAQAGQQQQGNARQHGRG